MKTLNVEDFINENTKPSDYRTEKFLSRNYEKYKTEKKISENLFLQVYIKDHVKRRFDQRFQTGSAEIFIKKSSESNATLIKMKDLPNWKSLNWTDFDRVLLNGINESIRKYKLREGAYLVISRSTNLVLPIMIATVDENINKRCACIDTVLHTAMNNNLSFFVDKIEYDHEKLYVEKVEERKKEILNEHKNSVGTVSFFSHSEMEFDVGLIIENNEINFDRNVVYVE